MFGGLEPVKLITQKWCHVIILSRVTDKTRRNETVDQQLGCIGRQRTFYSLQLSQNAETRLNQVGDVLIHRQLVVDEQSEVTVTETD